MTDELITALSKVEGLQVTSRTSVFAFKNLREDVRTIGSRLGVSAVLEGTVRKASNRLRITAQLTSVADGRTLWSERYDREMADVFAIQDEIAGTIVRTLRSTLLGELGDLTPVRYTENVGAYSLYLKGRFRWNRRTQADIAEGIKYFEQAIAEDPGYALACERAFLAALDGSCRTPIAGHAEVEARRIRFRGMILTPDGTEAHEVEAEGRVEEAAAIGRSAGEEVRGRAGPAFFESWS
jgi:hypothetical protein